MAELQRHDATEIESETKYSGSLAEALDHWFGNIIVLVSLFHRGEGRLQKSDGSSSTKEKFSLDEVRAACETKKQIFMRVIKGIDFNKKHAFGPVDRTFVNDIIELASGDWSNPEVIEQLIARYESVCHLWQ